MRKFFTGYLTVFLLLLLTGTITAQNLPLDAQGWTVFTPSTDTRIIYVSSSDGNDASAETYTSAQVNDPFNPPASIKTYKTVAEARKQLRDNHPDWILFKRGDVWYEQLIRNFKHSGRSADKPMLFGAYGDLSLDRPMFKTGESLCISTSNNGLSDGGNDYSNYLAFVSLHAYANERNPNDPEYTGSKTTGDAGCVWARRADGILLEDMKFDFYKTNLVFQTQWAGGELTMKNLTFRRCVITDAYKESAHTQGMFIRNSEDVLIEENVFDYNGWREGVFHVMYDRLLGHNIYVQYQNGPGTFTIQNNIFTRASSHGVQLRSGGILNGNYFARNPLHSFNRGDFRSCINNDNVYQESVDIVDGNGLLAERGMALDLFDLHPDYNHECKRNIISNDLSGAKNSYAIRLSDYSAAIMGQPETNYKEDWPSYAYNLTIEDNIVYNHRRGIHILSDSAEDITVKNNIIQNPDFDNTVMEEISSGNHTNMVFSGNKYYSGASANGFFKRGRTFMGFSQWASATGDSGSKVEQLAFPNPGRTSADYAASLGFNRSFDAFITEARKQRKGYWRTAFTSSAINNYIREGYGLDILSSDPIPEIGNNKLKMYPNPVLNSEILNITLDNVANSTIHIIDLKGAIVYSEKPKTSDVNIDVNKILKPGFYIVSVTTGATKVYNSKLIVK